MAAVITITNIDNSQNEIVVSGSIALSGNYGGGATHGDTLSLLSDSIKSSGVPREVYIFETPAAGTSASGYVWNFSPGTDPSNGVMQIFQSAAAGSPLAEFGQGTAYNAGQLAAVLKFQAWFPRV